jgi:DNA-binding transcriptional LysR family regulator
VTQQLTLHRLEGFYWVAKTGGYAKAARAFPYPITQPAVHQQVKKLEGELGVELFERVAKDSMQLTAAGQRLYRFVAPFFDSLPSVVRAVQAGDYGGSLVIHAAPMFVKHMMPRWIQRLSRARKDVRVELVEALATDVAKLRDGSADLLVDYLPEWPSDVATMRVGTLRAFVVLPAKHPLAKKSRLTLAQLESETFISYTPGGVAHEMQLRALEQHKSKPREMLSASSAESILAFVEAELGFSLLPWLDADGPRRPGVAALALGAPTVEFPVMVAWRKDTPDNPLLDAALEAAPKPE